MTHTATKLLLAAPELVHRLSAPLEAASVGGGQRRGVTAAASIGRDNRKHAGPRGHRQLPSLCGMNRRGGGGGGGKQAAGRAEELWSDYVSTS